MPQAPFQSWIRLGAHRYFPGLQSQNARGGAGDRLARIVGPSEILEHLVVGRAPESLPACDHVGEEEQEEDAVGEIRRLLDDRDDLLLDLRANVDRLSLLRSEPPLLEGVGAEGFDVSRLQLLAKVLSDRADQAVIERLGDAVRQDVLERLAAGMRGISNHGSRAEYSIEADGLIGADQLSATCGRWAGVKSYT